MLSGPVIAAARKYLGRPYVWKGKGDRLWSPTGLVEHAFEGTVFDCSGLVTTAIRDAGGPDWRATHSAQTLFEQCGYTSNICVPGVLRFYGRSSTAVTHVAICTGVDAKGNALVIEAAGGDSTTLRPKKSALVREGVELRRDFLGARVLP